MSQLQYHGGASNTHGPVTSTPYTLPIANVTMTTTSSSPLLPPHPPQQQPQQQQSHQQSLGGRMQFNSPYAQMYHSQFHVQQPTSSTTPAAVPAVTSNPSSHYRVDHSYRHEGPGEAEENQPLFIADVDEIDHDDCIDFTSTPAVSDTDHSEMEKPSPSFNPSHQSSYLNHHHTYFQSLPPTSSSNNSGSTYLSSSAINSPSNLNQQQQSLTSSLHHSPMKSSASQPLTLSNLSSDNLSHPELPTPFSYSMSKKDDMYRSHGEPINISLQSKKSQPAPINFVTRQLTKLKAVSHSVQVRVKRAMGTTTHTNPLLTGSGTGSGGSSSPYDRFKQVSIRRWKEIPAGLREKLLFLISSLLGTAFFFILFEAFFRVTSYNLSLTEEQTFTLSYVSAYLISIMYQHMLNRLLIFRSAPYCASLMHTYFVYSISLCVLTTIGAALIRVASINPRLIACFTLPASGVLNYYLLRVCLEGNSSMAPQASDKMERNLLIIDKNNSLNLNLPSGSAAGSNSNSSLSRSNTLHSINSQHSHHSSISSSSSLDTPNASSNNLSSIGLQYALGSPGTSMTPPPTSSNTNLSSNLTNSNITNATSGLSSSPHGATSGGRRFTVSSSLQQKNFGNFTTPYSNATYSSV